jgi:hypothetical protein
MYDALLFFHLLFAAALFVGMVTISAQVMGAQLQVGAMKASEALWGIGLIGTLVLGIWLSINVDDYDPWDAWVLIAIVLWLAAGGTGDRVRVAAQDAAGGAIPRQAVTAHWIRVALVVLLLADMVWKPWA